MSRGARIAIGVVALLCSSLFLMTALNPVSDFPAGSYVFFSMAALCAIIAIACFFPQSHPISLRIIGTTIFIAYVWYVVDSLNSQNLGRAIAGFLIWGLPSGYLAITGSYPFWGKGAVAFNSKQRNQKVGKRVE